MVAIYPSARLQASPFYESTLAEGMTAATVYNNMILPTGFGDPEAEYWRLIEGWAKWLRAVGSRDAIDTGDGLQVDTSLLAFELAASGCGIALARSSLAEQEIASGRLVRPYDHRVPIDEAFYLVSKKDKSEHPDSKMFREWLLENIEGERD